MFSAGDDELLIELVRKYRVLYDLSDPNYMDTEYKYEKWEAMAGQLKKGRLVQNTFVKQEWRTEEQNLSRLPLVYILGNCM